MRIAKSTFLTMADLYFILKEKFDLKATDDIILHGPMGTNRTLNRESTKEDIIEIRHGSEEVKNG